MKKEDGPTAVEYAGHAVADHRCVHSRHHLAWLERQPGL